MATKWGIISCGKISSDFVLCLRSMPSSEHQIVAIATRSLETAQKFAAQHHIKKAYGSYDELASDPEIEIVYNGNLNLQHYPLSKMMLEAGKHVLCEKPMCLNLDQMKSLIKVANSSRRFLMEAVWSRCYPLYERVREEVAKKTIGEPMIIHASFGVPIDQIDRLKQLDLGGGALIDIGIYTVQLAVMIFGIEKPKNIIASGYLNEDGVDEMISITLHYDQEKMACITISSRCQLENAAVIAGPKGYLKIESPFWCPTKLTIGPGKTLDFPLPDAMGTMYYTNSQGLIFEIRKVREYLQQGLLECPVMTLKESEAIHYIMTEVHRQLGVTYPQKILYL